MTQTDAGTEARPVATSVYGTRHFVHSQEPPAEWVARLREISPVSEQHAWLTFRWFAPRQRWVLYACLPEAFVHADTLAELRGPDPEGRDGDAFATVSRYQWEMYRAHRVYAEPYWVLQGTRGGHLVAWNAETQQLARLSNKYAPSGVVGKFPDRPPAPGDLDPCPFDERAVALLEADNALRAHRNDLESFRKAHGGAEGVAKQRAARGKHYRRELLKWLNDQLEEPLSYYEAALKGGELAGAPTTDVDYHEKDELADHTFVETGRVR